MAQATLSHEPPFDVDWVVARHRTRAGARLVQSHLLCLLSPLNDPSSPSPSLLQAAPLAGVLELPETGCCSPQADPQGQSSSPSLVLGAVALDLDLA